MPCWPCRSEGVWGFAYCSNFDHIMILVWHALGVCLCIGHGGLLHANCVADVAYEHSPRHVFRQV